jgi:hypothetical protein
MRTAPLIAAAAAVAILLVGCAPTGPTTGGGIYADPVEPTSSQAGAGPAPHADGAATAADQPPAVAGEAEGDLGGCVVGDWDIPVSSLMMGVKLGLQQNPEVADAAPEVDFQGAQWARLDGATLTTTYEHLVMHITMTVDGRRLEEFATVTGSTTQPYTVAGDLLTTGQIDVTGAAVTMSFTLDGQPFDFPGSGDAADQMLDILRASGGTSRVTCTPTTLHQVPLAGGQEVGGLAVDLARR